MLPIVSSCSRNYDVSAALTRRASPHRSSSSAGYAIAAGGLFPIALSRWPARLDGADRRSRASLPHPAARSAAAFGARRRLAGLLVEVDAARRGHRWHSV